MRNMPYRIFMTGLSNTYMFYNLTIHKQLIIFRQIPISICCTLVLILRGHNFDNSPQVLNLHKSGQPADRYKPEAGRSTDQFEG